MKRPRFPIRHFLIELRASFWLVPTLVVLGCVVLAAMLIKIDAGIDRTVLLRWPILFGTGADGSRAMLSAIASSMITVAGITFSITMVALTLTASYYSPRLLRNFVSDRSNQLVLGVFLGVFAYCLVVLRSVTSTQDNRFIPTISVLTAVFLALISLGFLIYFIHHTARSMQAGAIISGTAEGTSRAVANLFPQPIGKGESELEEAAPVPEHLAWRAVLSPQSGYLQEVDPAALMRLTREHGIVLRMERGIGEFATAGTPLVSIAGPNVSENLERRLIALFPLGYARTISQDAAFGIQELVDVALKALSPGVNDTTTAVTCVQYLGAVLTDLISRQIETPDRRDETGQVRLIARGPTFESLMGLAFDQIRRNARGNIAVIEAMLNAFETVGTKAAWPERRSIVIRHVEALRSTCADTGQDDQERKAINGRCDQIIHRL